MDDLRGVVRSRLASPPDAESKEVLDFVLLQMLSRQLGTKVIAIQLSEGTGAAGYAVCDLGIVSEHRFSDDEAGPAATIADVLARRGVPLRPFTFREAVESRRMGWELVTSPR